jgi:hypothetical protein
MAAAEDWPSRNKRNAPPAAERLRRVQELVRNLPTKPMSVDEFIAEKRREAERER